MDNKMKKYLGSEYDCKNHIKNFLLYWKKSSNGSGKSWRIENDLDCIYLCCEEEEDNEILKADTIVPMWAPIRMVAKFNSHCKTICKSDCDELLKNFHIYFKDNDMTKKLEELAKLAEECCNYMKLPIREMNRRGEMQLPATLFYCFQGGKFSKYFNNDNDTLEKWIKEEQLECAFSIVDDDGESSNTIERNNINKIDESLKVTTSVTRSSKENLICALLDYSIDLLRNRKEAMKLKKRRVIDGH